MDPSPLKERTYNFALQIIRFVESLTRNRIADVLGNQLLRCLFPVSQHAPRRHGSTEQRLLEIRFCRTQNPISSNDLSLENEEEIIGLIKSPVFLQDTTEFVKFGRSGTLI